MSHMLPAVATPSTIKGWLHAADVTLVMLASLVRNSHNELGIDYVASTHNKWLQEAQKAARMGTCEAGSFEVLNIGIEALCNSEQVIYTLVQKPICSKYLHQHSVPSRLACTVYKACLAEPLQEVLPAVGQADLLHQL